MFDLKKSKPKFSVIVLALFILLFTVAGIYIVLLMNAANPQPGISKNLETLTQEVLGEARDLKNAKGEQKNQLATKIKDTAKERKGAALRVMDEDPASFLRVAVPKNLKTEVLGEVAIDVEEEATIEGTIEVYDLDDFEKGVAKREHQLVTAEGKRYKLKFAQREPDVKTGDKVRAKGMTLDFLMAVDGSTTESFQVIQPSNVTVAATTVKKIAVLMFTFTDNSFQYYSKETINGQIFTNTDSVKNYFREVSYGQIDIQGKVNPAGDIYGWYQLPIAAGATCDYVKYRDTAIAEAQRLYGFSTIGYDNIVMMFPKASACTWGGLAGSGTPAYAWINQASGKTVMHEMGHNYGTGEGSAWSCTKDGIRVTVSDICSHLTYGNPFSVMGSPTAWKGHYVAPGKEMAGYITSNTLKTVTASGSYDVYPISKNTGINALRIPIEKDTYGRQLYYYVETRRTFGFDAIPADNTVQNGVLVMHAYGREAGSKANRLLDMTPATTSYYDAALTVGKTFSDPSRGVSITVTAADALKTTVSVTVPTIAVPCVKANPTLTISPLGQYGTSGQALTYQLTLKNNDNATCGTTTFNVTSALPSGFIQTPTTLAEALAPGASVTKSITITSPTTAVNAAYPFTITAKNSTATAYMAGVTANYNVYNSVVNPVVTPPVVTLTGITTGQVLTTTRVTVRANASDSTGISSITMYLDERRVVSCASVNVCSYLINPRKLLTGSHVLKAVAVDKENQSNSSSITFYKK